MISERATVVAVEGERAWIETARQSTCGSCGSQSSCGTSALAKVFGNRPLQVEVTNPIHAPVGSEVTIAVSEQGLMSGAARLYLLPLLALFLSIAGLQWLLPQLAEWVTVALSLLITALVVQWMRSRGWFEVAGMTPEITALHPQIQAVKFTQ